jgi:hypothetical protein
MFRNIVVVVATNEDYALVTSSVCGLPWNEVINLVGHLKRPQELGPASGLFAKQRFRSGGWKQFEYMS